MEITEALEWASDRRTAVLVTLRADGRAQSSDVAYVVDEGALKLSVTHDRAKTANMRRDPRVVVHVSAPDKWSYVSFDGEAELSPVAQDPGDATADALVAYYHGVRGEAHPDWEEYRRAMVAEGRLVVTVRPRSAVGQING